MTQREYDPFAASSGLADDFDADIVGAEFGYRSNYQNGETALLILTLRSTDGTPIGQDGSHESEVIYSCGNKWEVVPGTNGAEVRHESGKPSNFNKNSAVWAFIENVMKHDGGKLRASGTPMRAAGYQTLGGFHWNRVPYKGMGDETKDRLLPTGKSGSSNGALPQTDAVSAPAATSAPAPAAAPATPSVPEGLDAMQTMKLRSIAKRVKESGGDQEAFVTAVFAEVEGAEDSAPINNAILDMGPGSVFATA